MRIKWQYRTAQETVDSSGNPVVETPPAEENIIKDILVDNNSMDDMEIRPEIQENDPRIQAVLKKMSQKTGKRYGLNNKKVIDMDTQERIKKNPWVAFLNSLNEYLKEMFRSVDYSPANIQR